MDKIFEAPKIEVISLMTQVPFNEGGSSSGGDIGMGDTSNPFPDIP